MVNPDDDVVAEAVERLVDVIREELPSLLTSGCNWKFIFSGSSGGAVRTAYEVYGGWIVQSFDKLARPQ
jgi:hypothetical protein